MISDNAIPHCGLELGCCSRQIPYNMVEHDKIVYEDGYQQGRADGFTKSINILKGLDKQIAEIFENIVRNSEHYNCNNCEVNE